MSDKLNQTIQALKKFLIGTLIEQARKRLRKQWLDQGEKARKTESKRLAKPILEAGVKAYNALSDSVKKFQYHPEVEGQRMPLADAQHYREAKSAYEARLFKEDERKFDGQWKQDACESRLQEYIESLGLEQHFNDYYQQHPWLATLEIQHSAPRHSHTTRNYSSYKCLEETFEAQIKSAVTTDSEQLMHINEGGDERFKNSLSGKIIIYPWLRHNIVRHFSHTEDKLTIRPFSEKANRSSYVLDSHLVNRVDILRLLCNYYSDDLRNQRIAPLGKTDIERMPKGQLNGLRCILYNLNAPNEEAPRWILLRNRSSLLSSNWEAFVPQEWKEEQIQLPDGMTLGQVYPIDCQSHLISDEEKHFSSEQVWNAVLLQRVLPFARRGDAARALQTYRQNIPLMELLQATYVEILGDNAYVYSRKANKERLFHAFNYRGTLSHFRKLADLVFLSSTDKNNYLVSAQYIDSNHSYRYPFMENSPAIEFTPAHEQTLNENPSRMIGTALKIDGNALKREDILNGLRYLYHYDVESLTLGQMDSVETAQNLGWNLAAMADKNTSLRSLLHVEKDSYQADKFFNPLFHSAARNRLLACRNAAFLAQCNQDLRVRPQLWLTAGKETLALYQQPELYDLEFIQEAMAFKKAWKANFCPDMADKQTDAQWQFVQVAQMGKKLIDALFQNIDDAYVQRFNSQIRYPEPRLSLTFDLAGSIADNPLEYTRYIGTKLSHIKERAKARSCSPMFERFQLVLPEDPQDGIKYGIGFIFDHLNALRQADPQELSAVQIYQPELSNPQFLNSFLRHLLEKANANSNPLAVLIELPQLDRLAVPNDLFSKELFELYRSVQNKILDNQRKLNHPKFIMDTKALYDSQVEASLKIEEQEELLPQPWDEEDIHYPLGNSSLGIQQQLQEAVEQEQEQEQEEEEEQEQEQELDIALYMGDEKQLITRSNINERARDMWNAIDEDAKQHAGSIDDLVELFSLWVGSEMDAANVIEKIEPTAVKKMMENLAFFRQGISQNNLPAGFRLSYSKENQKLILCFNERSEAEELHAYRELPQKQRDPFKVVLHQAEQSKDFAGDFRQFNVVHPRFNANDLNKGYSSLWKFLAKENDDQERLANIQQWAQRLNLDEANGSVALQADILNNRVNPGSHQDFLNDLSQWLYQSRFAQGFIDCFLFEEAESAAAASSSAASSSSSAASSDKGIGLTEANLKAIGQVFYRYEITTFSRQKALKTFFHTAALIYHHFGSDALAIWKKRMLDPSNNACELLFREENEALRQSIATIEGKKNYPAIWWKLVDAHGQSLGHMRYAPLWQAFSKLLTFIEKNHLQLNEVALQQCLDGMPMFNGQVFLDRLLTVLKKQVNQPDAKTSQQYLLDNLSLFDWRHNGVYLAARYNEYVLAHPNLELQSFKNFQFANPDYRVNVDAITPEMAKDMDKLALRFAATKMKLEFKSFEKFEQLLSTCREQGALTHPEEIEVLRLLLSCLYQGQDEVDSIAVEDVLNAKAALLKHTEVRQWLGRQMDLSKTSGQVKWALLFKHVPALVQVLHDQTVINLNALNPMQSNNLLRNAARALQYFEKEAPEFLEEKLHTVIRNYETWRAADYDHYIGYPWINPNQDAPASSASSAAKGKGKSKGKQGASFSVDELLRLEKYCPEIRYFLKQLRHIHFADSTWLPKEAEIRVACINIVTADDKKAFRRELIQQYITRGAVIELQDSKFRVMNKDEMNHAEKYFNRYLKPAFESDNRKLFKQLMSSALAVNSEGTVKKDVRQLINCLASIDNKKYFNDLGQVLGLLLSHAKKHKLRFSLGQLTHCLERIRSSSVAESAHFPIDSLEALLIHDEGEAKLKGFFSKHLNNLSEVQEAAGKTNRLVDSILESNLPPQYQPALIRFALRRPHINEALVRNILEQLVSLHRAEVDSGWMKQLCQYIDKSASTDLELSPGVFKALSYQAQGHWTKEENPQMHRLWQKSQQRLLTMFMDGEVESTEISMMNTIRDTPQIVVTKSIELTRMIQFALQAKSSSSSDKEAETRSFQAHIMNWQMRLIDKGSFYFCEQLEKIVIYCDSKPHPTMEEMLSLLKRNPSDADELIHFYESGTVAGNKRHYSISDDERSEMLRVIQGIELKGKEPLGQGEQHHILNLYYYLNDYAEVENLRNLRLPQLQKLLDENRRITQSIPMNDLRSQDYREKASARLLAVMREILLRKTGKWPYHTQMFDLLYSALHNEDSILHQVKTGQGKSVITIMRAAYLALNGKVVDVFSAKDSLSKRDHEEFGHILDAMKVPHGHTEARGPHTTYQTRISRPLPSGGGLEERIWTGAVNYSTTGNFSLYHSSHIWNGTHKFDLDRKHRVAFLDECDHILNDEHTQFNFTDSRQTDGLYNFEAWVYQIAYEFYENHKHQLPVNESGKPVLSRHAHLKPLCEQIQRASVHRPAGSRFCERYLLPAQTGDKQAMVNRDNQLIRMLKAAHIAAELQNGREFCVRNVEQTMGGGIRMSCRFAKVMINNQVKNGSTYSDLVQQMLHIRLNLEAVENGERPDFFIEPDTQIALSRNATGLLKDYYSKLEGCTGTAGDRDELQAYEERFDIHHVVKLPTHEVRRSHYLPHVFSESENKQCEQLADYIRTNSDRPLLITCRDDIAVKRLFGKVKALLLEDAQFNSDRLICDTNDQGISENEMVPRCGKDGMVTFSARMGRGTDIKPDSSKGLMVIRTYSAEPRRVKQEQGRQGRNGANGTVVDVFNFAQIEKQWKRLASEERNTIYRAESNHLSKKQDKHQKKGSKKWNWVNEVEQRQKYLKVRTVQRMNDRYQKEQQKFTRRKEAMLDSMSAEVMGHLHYNMGQLDHEPLQDRWLETRGRIEKLWTERLKGQKGDSDAVYEQFSQKAMTAWESFARSYGMKSAIEGAVSGLDLSNIEEVNNYLSELEAKVPFTTYDAGVNKTLVSILGMYHPDRARQQGDLSIYQRANSLKMALKVVKPEVDLSTPTIPVAASSSSSSSSHSLDDVDVSPAARSETQIDTMAEALSFKQHWVHQRTRAFESPDYYDADRRRDLWGNHLKFMDKFYSKIEEMAAPKESAVLRQRQKDLFDGLKQLQTPRIFALPLSALTHIVNEIFNNLNDDGFENFLTSLKQFSEVDLFNGQSVGSLEPRRTQVSVDGSLEYISIPGDYEKYGHLADLIMNVAYQHNQVGSPLSKAFINTFSLLVKNDYWAQISQDKIWTMCLFFNDNPRFTRILAKITHENDLRRLLDLFMRVDVDYQKAQQLFDYLDRDDNIDYFEQHGLASVSLMQLFLAPELMAQHASSLNGYLPKANGVALLPEEDQLKFWNFLAERRPVEGEKIKDFFKLFEGVDVNGHYYQKTLKPLFELDAYVSLSFILKELKASPSRPITGDVKAIKLATRAFNHYLQQRKIVQNEHYHTIDNVEKREELHQELQRFNQMTAAESRIFFEEMANIDQNELPTDLRAAIFNKYKENNGLNQAQLKRLLAKVDAIQKTQLSSDKKQALFGKMKTEIQLNDINGVENRADKYNSRIDVMKALEKKKNWIAYFDADHYAKNRQARINIMRVLVKDQYQYDSETNNKHNVFRSECFDQYRSFINKLMTKHFNEQKKGSHKEIVTAQKTALKTIINLSDEMKDIVRDNGVSLKVGKKMQEMQRFFDDSRQRYERCWFVNRQHRIRAYRLFESLSPLNKEHAPDDFSVMLEKILTSQKKIIKSDVRKRLNRKGHSRLLDISMDMLIKVSGEALKNTHRHGPNKEVLSLLRNQCLWAVKLLNTQCERLGNLTACELRTALEEAAKIEEGQWNEGDPRLDNLRKLLERSDIALPAELKFMRDYLRCLTQAVDSEPQSTHAVAAAQ